MEVQDATPMQTYKQGDPHMPAEFREMLIKLLLDEHLENNGNTEYRKILANIANAGMRFAPHGRVMQIEAEILRQEVHHGKICEDLLIGLGAPTAMPVRMRVTPSASMASGRTLCWSATSTCGSSMPRAASTSAACSGPNATSSATRRAKSME
ncbi:hypothetical protein D9M73_72700 [compost metagenome]